jgi:hypothetical protein
LKVYVLSSQAGVVGVHATWQGADEQMAPWPAHLQARMWIEAHTVRGQARCWLRRMFRR